MGYLSRVGGRRVLLALGALYLGCSAVFLLSSAGGDRSAGNLLVLSGLLGASGAVLAYGGYRLPESNVRPDLYGVVAEWCVRGIGVMLGIALLAMLADSVDEPVSAFLVLPALASVAGLGVGYHDARARTRALDAEERQREAEQYSRELERYQTIVETVNDGIFVADDEHRFALVNDAYTELVGYDREELLGSSTSLVVADEEADVTTWAEEVRHDFRNGSVDANTYEAKLETAAGEIIDVEWTVAPLPKQGDGDAGRDRVVVVRDVTERNERERKLERQNDRLDSFAGMVAHELRNPVTIGQIYSQQLPAGENPEAVEYVTEAFDRIENIIDVMLVITRGREAVSESAPVDLAAAAREAWTEVGAPDAALEVTTDLTIAADETYVRHLFRNLFDNAVEHGSASPRSQARKDAVEHGSTGRETQSHDAVEHGSTSPRSQAHEDSVEHGSPTGQSDADALGDGAGGITVTVGELPTGFYVADDGTGIPPDEREAVFGTGYTTASSHGRMGLGLTFVREMADVYDWTCSLTESESGGARFEFENVTTVRDDSG